MTTDKDNQVIELAKQIGLLIGSGEGDFLDVCEGVAEGYALAQGKRGLYGPSHDMMVSLDSLRQAAETATAWTVEDARNIRMTWQEIADALEVSKQAAQQKYGKSK